MFFSASILWRIRLHQTSFNCFLFFVSDVLSSTTFLSIVSMHQLRLFKSTAVRCLRSTIVFRSFASIDCSIVNFFCFQLSSSFDRFRKFTNVFFYFRKHWSAHCFISKKKYIVVFRLRRNICHKLQSLFFNIAIINK